MRGNVKKAQFASGEVSGRRFLETFGDLLFPLMPELESLSKRIPANAKMTSSKIQNDVI